MRRSAVPSARDASADADGASGRDPFFVGFPEGGLGAYLEAGSGDADAAGAPAPTSGGDALVAAGDAATDADADDAGGALDAQAVDAEPTGAGMADAAIVTDASVGDATDDAARVDTGIDAVANGENDASITDASLDASDAAIPSCGDGAAAKVDVSGSWSLTYSIESASFSLLVDLTQSGDDVQGRYTGPYGLAGSATGTVSGNVVCLDLVDDGGACPGSYAVEAEVRGSMAAVQIEGDSCAGAVNSAGVASRVDAGVP